MKRALLWAAVAGCCWTGLLQADLKKAQEEGNLEKRSSLALDNAEATLKAARQAYEKGQTGELPGSIAEVEDSVDMAWDSLLKTGKNPRKSPRWFKRAEIRMRDLSRDLDSFQREMNYNDRPMLEKLRNRVQKIHEDLLIGLLEGNGR